MKKLGVILAGATLATTTMFAGGQADAATQTQPTVKKYVYTYNATSMDDLEKWLNQFYGTYSVPQKVTPQPTQPVKQTQTQPVKQTQPTAQATSVSEFEKQVATLVNQERKKAGLSPLQLDTKLSDVARTKSKDMMTKGYFDHQSPTYGSPFDMMKQFGITYRAAGENIAKGQQTPEEVMNSWMNSSGHRANILSANFTAIGVGFVKGSDGTTYWTQMFIGK